MLSALLAGSNFDQWLNNRLGPTPPKQISPTFRLSPGITSLRKFGQGVGSLQEIDARRPLSIKDSTQRVADLRALQLIADDPSTPSRAVLTPLGSEVLRRWTALKVADDNDQVEVVRALVVLRVAGDSGAFYGSLQDRWKTLLQTAPADFWLARPFATLLASYLNSVDGAGYNPWSVISSTGLTDHPDLLEKSAWNALASERVKNNPSEKPSGWPRGRLEEILARADDDRPIIGHHSFCLAMELRRREREDPIRIIAGLVSWSIYVA